MPSIAPRAGQWPSLFVFALLVAAVAVTGSTFRAGEWYAALEKPWFNPPRWIFAPVWTALYVAIAVAGWRVWLASRTVNTALRVWLAQLALNALWSWLFFGLQRPDLALIDIVPLLGLSVAFIFLARRHSSLASWLFVPYACWVAFATMLNASIWWLNR